MLCLQVLLPCMQIHHYLWLYVIPVLPQYIHTDNAVPCTIMRVHVVPINGLAPHAWVCVCVCGGGGLKMYLLWHASLRLYLCGLPHKVWRHNDHVSIRVRDICALCVQVQRIIIAGVDIMLVRLCMWFQGSIIMQWSAVRCVLISEMLCSKCGVYSYSQNVYEIHRSSSMPLLVFYFLVPNFDPGISLYVISYESCLFFPLVCANCL